MCRFGVTVVSLVCVSLCVCVAALMGRSRVSHFFSCSGCCVTVFTVRNSETQTGDKMFVLSVSPQTFTSSVRFLLLIIESQSGRDGDWGVFYLKPRLNGGESKMCEASTLVVVLIHRRTECEIIGCCCRWCRRDCWTTEEEEKHFKLGQLSITIHFGETVTMPEAHPTT